MHRTALLSVADVGAHGAPEDRTVQALREVLARGPFVEVDYARVPREQARVRAQLRLWSDAGRTDLILTAGGTGLAPRDRTPEATRDVVEREVPGLAERIRVEGWRRAPVAALERGLAGLRRGTLIVNLPAGPAEAADALAAVLPVLPSALRVLADATGRDDDASDDVGDASVDGVVDGAGDGAVDGTGFQPDGPDAGGTDGRS